MQGSRSLLRHLRQHSHSDNYGNRSNQGLRPRGRSAKTLGFRGYGGLLKRCGQPLAFRFPQQAVATTGVFFAAVSHCRLRRSPAGTQQWQAPTHAPNSLPAPLTHILTSQFVNDYPNWPGTDGNTIPQHHAAGAVSLGGLTPLRRTTATSTHAPHAYPQLTPYRNRSRCAPTSGAPFTCAPPNLPADGPAHAGGVHSARGTDRSGFRAPPTHRPPPRPQLELLQQLNHSGQPEAVVAAFESGAVTVTDGAMGEYVRALVRLDCLDGGRVLAALRRGAEASYCWRRRRRRRRRGGAGGSGSGGGSAAATWLSVVRGRAVRRRRWWRGRQQRRRRACRSGHGGNYGSDASARARPPGHGRGGGGCGTKKQLGDNGDLRAIGATALKTISRAADAVNAASRRCAPLAQRRSCTSRITRVARVHVRNI